jgi:hypothetical protein
MPLATGIRLGLSEIRFAAGGGGAGETNRAQDTRRSTDVLL